ncbi:amidohydrolase family protein [Bradyrhizobium sp. UFLA05-112]
MSTAAAPHVPVRPDWLALCREQAIEPELPIVDAHHHLWDRPGQRYLFDELLADTRSGHDIRATVFVQSRSMYRAGLPADLQPIGEVEFANGIAAQAACGLYGRVRACAAIVGFADLMLGDRVDAVLDVLCRAGGDRFRGIRNQTAWHADADIVSNPVPPKPGLLTHPQFMAGACRLPSYRLTLDVWAYHTQLAEFAELARSCPDTLIVLDHLGGPLGIGRYRNRREGVFAEWSADLKLLAELPNVIVKLGGLAMRIGGFDFHEQPEPPSSTALAQAWAPYVMTAIELFGPSRCMFESNFPVDKGMVSYVSLWNAFKVMTRELTPSERHELFCGTAVRTYGLPAVDLEL